MRAEPNGRYHAAASLLLLGGCLVWAIWPSMTTMADRWASDPRYAHGYLVPMFALALLWMRRSRLGGAAPRPSAWGWAPIMAGAAVHLGGGYFHSGWFDGLALLPYLGGLALLFGGWRYLGWAWRSIAFLAFMIPLPYRMEMALGLPLQFLATMVSTFLLQTMGFMAFAEGNAIQLDGARVNVAEACNGLSMLITFVALSTAAALVVRRPLVDRLVLVISAIPVALLANIVRIVATGILYETVGGELPLTFYHDLAGWVMIALALVLYWIEIAVLSRLRIETRRQVPSVLELVEVRRPAVAAPIAGQHYKPSIP
jgi:exosortase